MHPTLWISNLKWDGETEEGMHLETFLEIQQSFETSHLIRSDIPLPRPHLLILSNQFNKLGPKYSVYKPRGPCPFKPLRWLVLSYTDCTDLVCGLHFMRQMEILLHGLGTLGNKSMRTLPAQSLPPSLHHLTFILPEILVFCSHFCKYLFSHKIISFIETIKSVITVENTVILRTS